MKLDLFVDAYSRVMRPKQLQLLSQKLGGIGSTRELLLTLEPEKDVSWIQEDVLEATSILEYVIPEDATRPLANTNKLEHFKAGGYLAEWLIRTAFTETDDETLLMEVSFETDTDPSASQPLQAHLAAQQVRDMGERGYERALPCGLILARYTGLLCGGAGTDVEQYLRQGFGLPFELVGSHADMIMDAKKALVLDLDTVLSAILGGDSSNG